MSYTAQNDDRINYAFSIQRTELNGRLLLTMATVNVFTSRRRPPLQQGHSSTKDVAGELLQGTRSKRQTLFSIYPHFAEFPL